MGPIRYVAEGDVLYTGTDGSKAVHIHGEQPERRTEGVIFDRFEMSGIAIIPPGE